MKKFFIGACGLKAVKILTDLSKLAICQRIFLLVYTSDVRMIRCFSMMVWNIISFWWNLIQTGLHRRIMHINFIFQNDHDLLYKMPDYKIEKNLLKKWTKWWIFNLVFGKKKKKNYTCSWRPCRCRPFFTS